MKLLKLSGAVLALPLLFLACLVTLAAHESWVLLKGAPR